MLNSNVRTLKSNGFFDEINEGDIISFIAAPEIFGDGYDVPIVSIFVGDKVYLDFETGWNNLMKSYDSFDAYNKR